MPAGPLGGGTSVSNLPTSTRASLIPFPSIIHLLFVASIRLTFQTPTRTFYCPQLVPLLIGANLRPHPPAREQRSPRWKTFGLRSTLSPSHSLHGISSDARWHPHDNRQWRTVGEGYEVTCPLRHELPWYHSQVLFTCYLSHLSLSPRSPPLSFLNRTV